MLFLNLMYILFFVNSAIISIISMCIYGKTCQRSKSWANLMEEAQKDKFSKESLRGLRLTIKTSIISLILLAIAVSIRLVFLSGSTIQNDPIVVAPIFALFNVFNLIKSVSAKRYLQ
ncbi:MAG: hypothetical protein US76_02010 [Parcubacteria group bacterium GW2011_GWA2_38_13b]|nr:MAG: hypothetical protein US76_02010 [Parcubacteria group bacterium GW2011_GWA2_38_13b]